VTFSIELLRLYQITVLSIDSLCMTFRFVSVQPFPMVLCDGIGTI
jgi:hypothetical protein